LSRTKNKPLIDEPEEEQPLHRKNNKHNKTNDLLNDFDFVQKQTV